MQFEPYLRKKKKKIIYYFDIIKNNSHHKTNAITKICHSQITMPSNE